MMREEEKGLDKALKEWGTKQLFLALERRRARLEIRFAWLANKGFGLQASIEANLSTALLEGLNPNLHKYLYDDGEESK